MGQAQSDDKRAVLHSFIGQQTDLEHTQVLMVSNEGKVAAVHSQYMEVTLSQRGPVHSALHLKYTTECQKQTGTRSGPAAWAVMYALCPVLYLSVQVQKTRFKERFK